MPGTHDGHCRERQEDRLRTRRLRTRRLRRAARGPEMSIKERLAALQLAGTGEFVPSASVNPTATRTRAESGETAPRDVTFERADVTSQATGFKPKYGRSDKKEDGSPTVRGTSLFSGRLLKAGKGLKKNVFGEVWAVLRDEPPTLTFYADETEARTIGAPLQLDKLPRDDWLRRTNTSHTLSLSTLPPSLLQI